MPRGTCTYTSECLQCSVGIHTNIIMNFIAGTGCMLKGNNPAPTYTLRFKWRLIMCMVQGVNPLSLEMSGGLV